MLDELLQLGRNFQKPKSYFQGISTTETILPKELVIFHRHNFPIHRNINYHHRFMLVVCLSGEGTYFVDNESRTLKAGECTVILPYQFHRVEHLADKYDWTFITFEDENNNFCGLNGLQHELTHFQLSLLLEILTIHSKPMGKIDIKQLLLTTATLLTSLEREGKVYPFRPLNMNSNDTFMHQILKVIHKHPTESPDVTAIAKAVNKSESHLRRIFRNVTGISIGQFILNGRMNRAMRKLASSGFSINEVAYYCGYESVPSFCKCFKQYTGLTPSEFRKRLKKPAPSAEKEMGK